MYPKTPEETLPFRCRSCGKVILCPHCGKLIEGNSIVYEWGDTPEETKIYCSKSCEEYHHGNKRISRIS